MWIIPSKVQQTFKVVLADEDMTNIVLMPQQTIEVDVDDIMTPEYLKEEMIVIQNKKEIDYYIANYGNVPMKSNLKYQVPAYM